MPLFKTHDDSEDFYLHQRRLIRCISYELLVVCVLVISAYAYKKLWYLVAVIGIGGILVLLNLWHLTRSRNLRVCSHFLISIVFLTIIGANYLVWGIGTTYSYWFYIIPLLAAASLVGWSGIIIYSTIALLMILTFGAFSIPPFYHLPPHLLAIINWTNHLFAYLITVTIIIHFMLENKHYERILNNKNHLLMLEKEKFQYLANYDQQTHLPNRHYFKQSLQEIIDSLSANYCVTVFFMDLDHLKYVNDCYGHDAGDELIIQSAKRFEACFRTGDFIARLGGDEFTSIAAHTKDDDIPDVIAKRIIQAFEKSFLIATIEYQCSVSIGLSNYPKDSQTIKELMTKADLAMYESKKIKGSAYTKARDLKP